jgi:hypothetical protein
MTNAEREETMTTRSTVTPTKSRAQGAIKDNKTIKKGYEEPKSEANKSLKKCSEASKRQKKMQLISLLFVFNLTSLSQICSIKICKCS